MGKEARILLTRSVPTAQSTVPWYRCDCDGAREDGAAPPGVCGAEQALEVQAVVNCCGP